MVAEMSETVHGYRCYSRGCDLGENCEAKKKAAREYMREYRANKKAKRAGLGRLRAVPTPHDPELPTTWKPAPGSPLDVRDDPPAVVAAKAGRRIGPVGTAVRAEIDAIKDAKRDYPGNVAMALALADDVDWGDPLHRVSAVREIAKMLKEMRPVVKAEAQNSARDRLIESLARAL